MYINLGLYGPFVGKDKQVLGTELIKTKKKILGTIFISRYKLRFFFFYLLFHNLLNFMLDIFHMSLQTQSSFLPTMPCATGSY